MRSFINLADVERTEIEKLLARAALLRAGKPSHFAFGKTLGLLFLNPSLRTHVSMVAAWSHLGGTSIALTPGQGAWKLHWGDEPMLGDAAEHAEEAAAVLGRLCHLLGVRAFAAGKNWAEDRRDAVMALFKAHSAAPLVNMESGLYHPCQALADWLTLDDHKIPSKARFVLTWGYHPKALPQAVPNSALLMACQRGMQVTLLRPNGYHLDPDVMAQARALASQNAGALTESDDPSVLGEADVVYAKAWGSLAHYGDAASETKLRSNYRDWCVGQGPLRLGKTSKLMHCLPVRRDVEVATALLKSPQSLILDEAANRTWAQAAVLEHLALGSEL